MSRETGLPDRVSAQDTLWRADFPGQSAPVIANGKLYAMGYEGQGADLQEGVACFDAETGSKLWQHLYNDYLSDTIYLRYATGSPAIDPETGNVYMQGTQGILAAFTEDGRVLWQHSLMEEFGRLTFPNGRTASPLIDADLVITRGITANWGTQGPGADRFYAFDKKTGEPVWASSPGARRRTIPIRIRSLAGIRAGASSLPARGMGAWCAPTRGRASRSGACRCSGLASIPQCSSIMGIKSSPFMAPLTSGANWSRSRCPTCCRLMPPPAPWCSNANSSNSGRTRFPPR